MSWFSSLFKGAKDSAFSTDPHIETKVEPDPYKVAVSSPLSSFLAGQIGQGIGEYQTDPNYTNRYNDYLSMDPGQYFDKNIAAPATEQYKRDFLPLIQEGFAGNLRGSGRYNAQTEGINTFSEGLARNKSEFVPQFAKSQIDVGQSEFARRYANWFQGLAVNNPALKSAIDFLHSDSGYNILSALNPGKQGWFGDLLKAGASIGSSAAVAGCWVAAEVFDGWQDTRTHKARYYINNHAPKWFKHLYLKYGERAASWLKSNPFMKKLVKPIFETFARLGGNYASL